MLACGESRVGDHFESHVIATILTGAAVAIPALYLMYLETRAGPLNIGRRFWPITIVLSCTVLLMASGRHLYREASIADHRAMMAAKTKQYMEAVEKHAPRQ